MDKYTKAIIQYYNVIFYLYIQNEGDLLSVRCFMKNINKDIRMKDIFEWCKIHNIFCTTKFRYRKDFSYNCKSMEFLFIYKSKIGNMR